jgi:AcrR family transcriptional regulator
MRNAKEAIKNAGMQLFAAKGYAGCSIREICACAGVTKPVLYYHYRSKEHLYQELMLEIFNDTRKNLLRLEKSGGSVRERLEHFVFAEFGDTKRDPSGVKLIFRMMFSPEEGYPYFNYVEEFLSERKVIAECIRSGYGRAMEKGKAETSATAVMGMMLILVLEHLFTGKNTLSRKNARDVIELLLPDSKEISKPIGKP